tara:strand:+ start:531 stop:965 length:435 start_codon:yes stop_codon:yes gene_type:complete
MSRKPKTFKELVSWVKLMLLADPGTPIVLEGDKIITRDYLGGFSAGKLYDWVEFEITAGKAGGVLVRSTFVSDPVTWEDGSELGEIHDKGSDVEADIGKIFGELKALSDGRNRAFFKRAGWPSSRKKTKVTRGHEFRSMVFGRK